MTVWDPAMLEAHRRWEAWRQEALMDASYGQYEMFSVREMQGVPQAPWDGESPRRLTKCFGRFSLGAPPAGGLHADE